MEGEWRLDDETIPTRLMPIHDFCLTFGIPCEALNADELHDELIRNLPRITIVTLTYTDPILIAIKMFWRSNSSGLSFPILESKCLLYKMTMKSFMKFTQFLQSDTHAWAKEGF